MEYLHVEIDRHDVLLAEGLPAESYLACGDRGDVFSGAARRSACTRCSRIPATRPTQRWAHEGACAPIVVAGPVLAAMRARLA